MKAHAILAAWCLSGLLALGFIVYFYSFILTSLGWVLGSLWDVTWSLLKFAWKYGVWSIGKAYSAIQTYGPSMWRDVYRFLSWGLVTLQWMWERSMEGGKWVNRRVEQLQFGAPA